MSAVCALHYWVLGLLRSKFWLMTTDFSIPHSEFFKGRWLQAPAGCSPQPVAPIIRVRMFFRGGDKGV
ncbi:MAG: hypothetical protein AB1765_03260 [Candidatus Hydrogenedentota bacterium]